MIIRDFIYFMPMIIFIIGIVSIILSLKVKDKKNKKYIVIMDVINIIYLFIISFLIHNMLSIIVNLGILFVWFISFLGAILYMISIIICLLTMKKANNTTSNKKIYNFVLVVLLIPIILFIILLGKELYLVNNSSVLLSYYSAGNGSVGDSNDFTYAISDNYCKEISFDIRYSNLFIPKRAKKINEEELKNKGYKNNKLIHNERINKNCFNISLKEIYYNEKSFNN